MSIDHKAWLFDSSLFELEIAQSLYRAPPERRFDPGRMGTGFISKQRVQFFSELLSTLGPSSLPPASSHWYAECLYRPASDEDLARVLAALTHGFSAARQRGLGLLLVNFRE